MVETRCVLLGYESIDYAKLAKQLSKSDIVVGLSMETTLLARQKLVDYSVGFVSSLIPHELVCRLATEALELFASFQQLPLGLSLDGIDWLELVSKDQQLFYFREYLFAYYLAAQINTEKLPSVVWVGYSQYSLHLPSYIFLETLRHELNCPLTVFDVALQETQSHVRSALQKLTRRVLKTVNRNNRRPFLVSESEIVAVFERNGWVRFREPLEKLSASLPSRLQVWCLAKPTDAMQTWAKSNDISLNFIPYPQVVEHTVQDTFAQAYAQANVEIVKAVSVDKAQFDLPSPFLRYLEFVFLHIMPRLAQWGRTLREALLDAGTQLVIGSTAFTRESMLPFYVAQAVGIPSVALSHTYVSGDHSIVKSHYLVCRNKFERHAYKRAFPNDNKILFAHDSISQASYFETQKKIQSIQGEKLIVAILTGSPTSSGRYAPFIDAEKFWLAYERLLWPPDSCSDFEFVFKFHPKDDTSAYIAQLSKAQNVRIWPAQNSLSALLEAASITVVCNHYGGVVVEAIQSGQPTVFLDTADYCYPFVETLAYDSGLYVTSVEEFWAYLPSLVNGNSEIYQQLQQKRTHFERHYLQHAPDSLVTVISKLMTTLNSSTAIKLEPANASQTC